METVRNPTSPPIPAVRKGFSELVREGCEGYVVQGIGLPLTAYAFHAVKLCLYVLGWMFFCSFTPGLGSPAHLGSWWFEGIAFQKAFIWACLVEVLGCGCMSGPLGFHIWPPFTAFLHFLRPGTIKLAPLPNLPARFQEYNYVDGENVAGSVLGWNFGEGHLCSARLLQCVQEQCHFEDGELRAIVVESQPLLGSTLHWRIFDAQRGLLAQGYAALDDLAKRAPWDYGEI